MQFSRRAVAASLDEGGSARVFCEPQGSELAHFEPACRCSTRGSWFDAGIGSGTPAPARCRMPSTHLSDKTRMKTRIETLAATLTVGLVIGTFPFTGRATDDPLAAIPFDDADPAVGRDINEVCAGCHGEYGQGDS